MGLAQPRRLERCEKENPNTVTPVFPDRDGGPVKQIDLLRG